MMARRNKVMSVSPIPLVKLVMTKEIIFTSKIEIHNFVKRTFFYTKHIIVNPLLNPNHHVAIDVGKGQSTQVFLKLTFDSK